MGSIAFQLSKTLLDRSDPLSDGAPTNFENDESLPSLSLCLAQQDSNETFMQKYRRLFSNLNRYAKSEGYMVRISAMDEDDLFAIITLLLIPEHSLLS